MLSLETPHNPVGKGILQTSSQYTMVGGKKLGTDCHMVLVHEVLKSDALLVHEHEDMKRMSDALKCSIAWPTLLVISSIHYSMLFYCYIICNEEKLFSLQIRDNAISKAPPH